MHSSPAPHDVDVLHNIDPDEWYVTVDGRRVLTFSGPSAWTMALSHQAELNQLLGEESGLDTVPQDSTRVE